MHTCFLGHDAPSNVKACALLLLTPSYVCISILQSPRPHHKRLTPRGERPQDGISRNGMPRNAKRGKMTTTTTTATAAAATATATATPPPPPPPPSPSPPPPPPPPPQQVLLKQNNTCAAAVQVRTCPKAPLPRASLTLKDAENVAACICSCPWNCLLPSGRTLQTTHVRKL